jgi:hypothetical protein
VLREEQVMKRARQKAEPPGVGASVLAALGSLGVIAIGLWITVTGVWTDEGRVYAEGLTARAVGCVIALIGVVGLVRVLFRLGCRG